MKLLIEIDEDYYNIIKHDVENGMDYRPCVIIANGMTHSFGHWIADVDKWGDIVTTVNGYRCDKCNTFNADKDNYCPNCGAKMVEPKESEDNNG